MGNKDLLNEYLTSYARAFEDRFNTTRFNKYIGRAWKIRSDMKMEADVWSPRVREQLVSPIAAHKWAAIQWHFGALPDEVLTAWMDLARIEDGSVGDEARSYLSDYVRNRPEILDVAQIHKWKSRIVRKRFESHNVTDRNARLQAREERLKDHPTELPNGRADAETFVRYLFYAYLAEGDNREFTRFRDWADDIRRSLNREMEVSSQELGMLIGYDPNPIELFSRLLLYVDTARPEGLGTWQTLIQQENSNVGYAAYCELLERIECGLSGGDPDQVRSWAEHGWQNMRHISWRDAPSWMIPPDDAIGVENHSCMPILPAPELEESTDYQARQQLGLDEYLLEELVALDPIRGWNNYSVRYALVALNSDAFLVIDLTNQAVLDEYSMVIHFRQCAWRQEGDEEVRSDWLLEVLGDRDIWIDEHAWIGEVLNSRLIAPRHRVNARHFVIPMNSTIVEFVAKDYTIETSMRDFGSAIAQVGIDLRRKMREQI